MRPDLPTGTVTFLFTDVEGSTRLLEEIGDEAYDDALAEHRRVVREACAEHGGVEVDTQGDAFFFAFPTAPAALAAASAMTSALASGLIRIRIGLHTGEPRVSDEGYVGKEVHFAARVAATGHGGQIVLSKAAASLVEANLTDLGEQRLKDIPEPVPIYQLGDEPFPPLKTISNTNLPRSASSFVGRERELSEILAEIEQGARLLTLTGPGGSGKTRLALEAAATLVPEYKAGVFWVGLAPLRDASLVTEQIAQTLGAKDGLAEHIGEREMLLLLDNLEQVVKAAPELSRLLQACPSLTLLCTSRELLRVQGEVEYAVPPLASREAVSLFCERSRLEPSDEIVELCARLDNLPLAVELAAARTRALSPAQILERLSRRLDLLRGGRDADPRQQTLRATIEWSYGLLTEEEQRLFRGLSVFAGGCTLEAAEAVCDANLDTLQSLVEKSLLRFTASVPAPRYWMLETIREYAGERLEVSGEAARLRGLHAECFLARTEEAEPHLRQESTDWLDWLEPEHDNVRAAFDFLETAGEDELALRLVAAFWWFWSLRGHLDEGLRRVEAALAQDTRPTPTRAMALTGASDLAGDLGDNAMSRLRGEQALALYRELGDDWGVAYNHLALGLVFAIDDEWSSAKDHFEEGVRLFEERGEEHWALQVSRRLAWSYEELGERERAREIHEDVLRRARATGDVALEARSLAVLAMYSLDDDRVDEVVVSRLRAAHRILRERPDHPDRYQHLILVCRFARALALRDRSTASAKLLACYQARLEDIGVEMQERWLMLVNEQTLAAVQAQLDEPSIAQASQEGAKLTIDEAVELALVELDVDA